MKLSNDDAEDHVIGVEEFDISSNVYGLPSPLFVLYMYDEFDDVSSSILPLQHLHIQQWKYFSSIVKNEVDIFYYTYIFILKFIY